MISLGCRGLGVILELDEIN